MRNEINLQDRMLAALRQQSQNTTFFLMNGFQMRGIIRGFDNFVVILESEGGACGQLITYEALHGTKTENKTGTAAET